MLSYHMIHINVLDLFTSVVHLFVWIHSSVMITLLYYCKEQMISVNLVINECMCYFYRWRE